MSWFKRIKTGITTKSKEKKEIPEGLWYKCPECKNVMTSEHHSDNNWVCDKCQYHEKLGSLEYFYILFDENEFEEIAANMISGDPLQFTDTKAYKDRIKTTIAKTGLKDALRVGFGDIEGYRAQFWVWHQTTRTKNPAKFTNHAHHIWGSYDLIEIHPAFGDFCCEIIATNEFNARCLCFADFVAFSKNNDAYFFTSAVR